LDIDSKKWRLRADFLNDAAMAIELFLLPYYPKYSVYILCGTTVMRSLVGVAGGATRSAMTLHHAIRNNMADVSAKDSAQETCVNLLGSVVGLFLLTGVTSATWLASIFFFVTFIHMYANVRAVKAVCLKTFNEARYLIALEEYFRNGSVLPPKVVNHLERVTLGQTVSLTLEVKLGCSVKDLTEQIRNRYEIEDLIACFEQRDKFLIAETRNYVGVFLHYDIKPHEILRAYFFVASYLQDRTQIRDNYWEVQAKWSEFLNLAQLAGYNVHSHLLGVDEYRCDWRFI
jgi:Vitamin B6 photo-protection and homoeostasis